MSAVKSFAFVPMNIFAFANCFFILRCFLAKERAFPFCIVLHGGACQHEMCTLLTEFLSFDENGVRSVTASLVSSANDCVCFPFILVPKSSCPDCLPASQASDHVALGACPPPGQPPSVTLNLPLFCLPGVERRRHSDFLLFICCMGRPDHSLFLQQIPQQLLQVCRGTSSPRGGWWVGLGPGDRTLGWVITCLRPHPHISPETGPDSCIWRGGNPLRRLSCGLLVAWAGPQDGTEFLWRCCSTGYVLG